MLYDVSAAAGKLPGVGHGSYEALETRGTSPTGPRRPQRGTRGHQPANEKTCEHLVSHDLSAVDVAGVGGRAPLIAGLRAAGARDARGASPTQSSCNS